MKQEEKSIYEMFGTEELSYINAVIRLAKDKTLKELCLAYVEHVKGNGKSSINRYVQTKELKRHLGVIQDRLIELNAPDEIIEHLNQCRWCSFIIDITNN